VAVKAAPIDRRVLVALALLGPLVAAAVASGASRMVQEQRRTAATARDLTTFFGAAYGVLQAAESAQRALVAALAARDTGVRFVPQYQAAAAALRAELTTVSRLTPLAPECSPAARDVARPFEDAAAAADRVVGALRAHDHDRAVVAGYEFQAAIALTRDAAQALVEVVHASLPRRLGALTDASDPAPGPRDSIWAAALGAVAVALVIWGALGRGRVRRAHPATTPLA
jgi:hypothetical protein